MNIQYPKITHPDQDFVAFYNKIWSICDAEWVSNKKTFGKNTIILHPAETTINQFTTIMSTFFLIYGDISVTHQLDFFYQRQEEDGAIRSDYSIKDGSAVKIHGNPLGVGAPLFSWAEYNLYHKIDSKRRVHTVVKILEKYWQWLEQVCLKPNGLYSLPLAATGMRNSPREKLCYPIDFNLQQAINANFMAKLGTIINDKDMSFRYRKKYFRLRTQINSLMWNRDHQFYFDLDEDGKHITVKTIAAFWALLAQLPNEAKLEGLIGHLNNPKEFAQKNIFPTLSKDERAYRASGEGYRGSVFPPYTYMIIKGLENYAAFKSAKEYAYRHVKAITETIKQHASEGEEASMVEAYQPESYDGASWSGKKNFPKKRYVPYLGLSGIAIMIENIIGLRFSVPRKTVELLMTGMEHIGIEDVSLRKNLISIVCDKTGRGWEIHLGSEKLYYFTLHLLNNKKKTLPIPSGRCSLLIGKL